MAIQDEQHPGPAAAVATTGLGRRIHVDPADPRAAELLRANGDLNPRSLLMWRRVVAAHRWDLIVDVGVNYGEMLVGVDLPADAEVIGFEPNLALHPFLQRTLVDNGLERVQVRAAAVADRVGTARFAVDSTWSGTSSLDPGDRDDPERWTVADVPVTTLDTILAERPAGLASSFCVKVDVEGFEREVVGGAAAALGSPGPWVVMLEVLHMAPGVLAELARRFAVLLLESGSDRLVRPDADEIDQLVLSGRVYPQDCLLVSPGFVESLAG